MNDEEVKRKFMELSILAEVPSTKNDEDVVTKRIITFESLMILINHERNLHYSLGLEAGLELTQNQIMAGQIPY